MEVYDISNTTLSNEYVDDALTNFDIVTDNYNESIKDPKVNDIYLFYTENINKTEDYKVDGYKWRNNGAKKPVPLNKPLFYKTYYYVKKNNNELSKDFQKHVYEPLETGLPKLIHYMGVEEADMEIYKPSPHGNIKKKTAHQVTNELYHLRLKCLKEN